MDFYVPNKVNHIIDILTSNGYEAYAVGGCVRDTILGKEPEDWDITTSAKPEEIKLLFKRTVDTGIEHGTVTIIIDNQCFETTTYRLDGEYEDKRHPKQVSFTSNLKEDLRRRDFTINAMAYNEQEGLVDLFGGLEDLKNKTIRCVGNPIERFDEDALRILRAIRFSAQLGFDIDEETIEGIKSKVNYLSYVSAERINVELNKLIISDNPDIIRLAYELGITKVILPEFDKMMTTNQNTKHHIYNVGEHTIEALKLVAGPISSTKFTSKERKILRWTILLHDIEKPSTISTDNKGRDHFYGHEEKGARTAKAILERLRFDRDSMDKIVHLIKYHDYRYKINLIDMRKAIAKIGVDYMELLFEINYADNMAKNPEYLQAKLDNLREAKSLYNTIIRNKDCVEMKTLEITGKDLINIGYKQGKEIGKVLNHLLEKVIEDPLLNKRETLLEIAYKIKN